MQSSSIISRSHEETWYYKIKNNTMFKQVIIIISLFVLTGCMNNLQDSYQGLDRKLVKSGQFYITTYQKITDPTKPYIFYIEGDGNAFKNKRPTLNPTPHGLMMIKLAASDPRANIIYIARPCQYTPISLNYACNDHTYWTSKRLSNEAIDVINMVIDQVNDGKGFHLIGFSGGGGIAVLIAARNPNVIDIITISGNLDTEGFTAYHSVSPMQKSLNPIDYAKKLNHIPQLHLSGSQDKIIPPFIAKHFVKASNSRCVKQKIYNAQHNKGWEKLWHQILQEEVSCK